MEIEEKLKEAAPWQPKSEMPLGLEQRALRSYARPPLRPIGITRPRSILLATSMAAAVCVFTVLKVGQQPIVMPTPIASTDAVVPIKLLSNQTRQSSKDANLSSGQTKPSLQITKPSSRKVQQSSKIAKQSLKQTNQSSKPKMQSLKPHPIAVDTQSDSVKAGSRVAVEAPLYTPAYYAEPSADGQSISYMPVALSVNDPDVIYSETNTEN